MVSDFDNEFANREKMLTPEHTPLKIKDINVGPDEIDFSVHRNSTVVNGSAEDKPEYLRDRSYSQGGKRDNHGYNNKKKDNGFMSTGPDDYE